MKDEQYRRAVEIFQEAVDLEGEVRENFLDNACEDDAELRAYVERLLAEDSAEEGAFEEGDLCVGHALLADVLGVDSDGGDVDLTPTLPETVGRFRIREKIGEGGMGAVYLAEQDHPKRSVALKMIRPGMLSPGLRKRFKFEAEVLGKLQHPGIAQIYEAGEHESDLGPQPYFAMEYIQGVELRQYVKENHLSVRARLELVSRIAVAVHHAHQQGIVHRDLKPENVLVTQAPGTMAGGVEAEFADLGQPKILDFGVARATDADIQLTTMRTELGQLVGTLPYMSPEQVAGDPRTLDTRSDIYALGVLLYELLAGRPPFNLRNMPIPEAARIIREEEPTRLGSIDTAFRGDIDTIACMALEKDRNRRYDSAAELASDLRRYLANEPIIAHPPSTFYQLKKFAQRHRGLVAGLALTLLVLMAGIIISLALTYRALQGEKRAEVGEAAAERNAQLLLLTTAQAVGEKDSFRALAHLEAVSPEFRDWEWRYLNACFNAHIAEYEGSSFTGHSCMISRGPGNSLLAALQRDEGIELVDLASGEVLGTFSLEGGLKNPSLAPDGSLLSTLSMDVHTLHVWDTQTRELLFEVPVPDTNIYGSFFCPQGERLVISLESKPAILVHLDTGRSETLPGMFMQPDPQMVGFTPDGKHLIAKIRHVVQYSLEEKRVLTTLRYQEDCQSLAICPASSFVAIGERQRMIYLLDLSTLELNKTLRGHTQAVHSVAFSNDGRYLASAALDNTIRVWNTATGEVLRVLGWKPEEPLITTLRFSGNGDLLAAGNTGKVRLWKWKEDTRHVLEGINDYVYHVAFHPDGSLLASSMYVSGTVCLWDTLTGEQMVSLPEPQSQYGLGFTADGARLVTRPSYSLVRDKIFRVWDPWAARLLTEPRSGEDASLFETLETLDIDSAIRYFRTVAGGSKITPDYGEVLASSADRSLMLQLLKEAEPPYEEADRYSVLFLCDVETGKRIRVLGKHDTHIVATAFSPDGTQVVSGDYHGVIKVWSSSGGPELATLKAHPREVYSLAFHPDGTRFVSGGNDSTIIVWDARTFEQVLVLRGHTSYVHSLVFSPDGTRLVSGSGDSTVRIWDSLPPAERWSRLRAAEAQRREVASRVDRLLAELDDPGEVSEALRNDPSLSVEERKAALWVLLKRCSTGHQDR